MLAKLIEFATNHYVLASLFLVLLIALVVNEARRGGRSLSNRELTSLVNRGEGVVLDVRARKEFDAGHVVDALNIPHDKVVNRVAELEKYKGKTLVVVDAMGQHSGTVCSELNKLGFNAVKLSGGISSWRADNLPLVK
jgi:rhodanese-related sulfurtransferase